MFKSSLSSTDLSVQVTRACIPVSTAVVISLSYFETKAMFRMFPYDLANSKENKQFSRYVSFRDTN